MPQTIRPDEKIMQQAVDLTIKAMGAEGSAANWIGQQEHVAGFLAKMVGTLTDLRWPGADQS